MSSTTDGVTGTDPRPPVETVNLMGEYDLERSDELRRALLGATTAEVVRGDMSGVTFVDSSAMGTLVAVQHYLQLEGRRLELVNVGSAPRKVFEIAGLIEHFAIM